MSSLAKYENTDWERLKAEDKEEYLTKRDEYRAAQNHIQQLKQRYQSEAIKQNEEQQKQFAQAAQEEHQKLVNILPA